ncbi:UNVERIFIED_CONTAM: hypothetical protein H355_005625, partial [Colinus virginianus]
LDIGEYSVFGIDITTPCLLAIRENGIGISLRWSLSIFAFPLSSENDWK